MRLVLALLMCWGVAFAQDTTKYFKSVDYGWNWQRGKFRGGLILPTDTVNNKLGIAQIGATCFAWSGVKWNPISTTDTAFLVRYYRKNQVDSAILANTPVPFDSTSLSNRINLRVKYTDTAAMLNPYLRKGDTTSLSNRINLKLNKSDSTAGGYYPYSSNPKAYLTSASLTGYVPYSSYGSNNVSANNYFDGFTSVAASGTQITLTVNSTPSYLVTGSGGQTIKLPDATTLPNGAVYDFNNNQSSGAILVNNNSNTLVKSIPSGGYLVLTLIDNSIAAGSWDAHFQAPSNVSWSTNTFDYAGSITSATWNGVKVAINRGGTGATTADSARINLGATTVGGNFFTLTNPSAKRFTQINADNTVSTLDSTAFRTAIGAGTFTLPSLTSGSVLFSNGTTITQDNSNLFWDNTNKRLGIGTTSPAAGVNVSGSVVGAVRFQCNNTNSGGFSDFSLFNNTAALSCQMIGTTEATTGAAGYGRIRSSNGSSGLLLAAGGTNLLKFQTNDADRITVSGTGAVTIAALGTGTVYSNSGVLTNTNPSDERLKHSISTMPYGLDEILKLQPKIFYYNSDTTDSNLKYGFIAQEVQNVMPTVIRKLDDEGHLGLESDGIYVAMVKAIQQLESRVKELEKLLNK